MDHKQFCMKKYNLKFSPIIKNGDLYLRKNFKSILTNFELFINV